MIERQQPAEDDVLLDIGGCFVGRPAIRIPDGAVEGGMGVGEPGWMSIVEVGQCSLLQLGLSGIRRIEPALAQCVQLAGSIGDRLDTGSVRWLLARAAGSARSGSRY